MADILNVFRTVYETVGDIAYLKAATAVDNTNKYMKQSTDQLNASQAMLDAKLHLAEAAFLRQSEAVKKNQDAVKSNQTALKGYTDELANATARAAQFEREAQIAAKAGLPINAGIALGNQAREQANISQLNDAIKRQNVVLTENQIKLAQSTGKAKEASASQEELKVKMEQVNKVLEARSKEEGKLGFFEQLKARIGKTFSSLEQFGKDFDSVTRTAHRAANATEKFLNIFDRLSIAIRGKPIFDYDKSVKQAASSTEMLSQGMDFLSVATVAATNPALGLAMAATMLGQILAQVVTQGIQMVVAGFIQMAQASVSVVAGYESQIMTLKSMVATDLMAADATLVFNDAMTQSTEKAIELTKWVEELAIKSPFSEADVKATLTQAKGYGFTADEAARVTNATLNWAAATGKQGYQLGLVGLAIGQVRSQGRLLGGELNQLRGAGVDINAVFKAIADTLGKTTDEVRQMQVQGKLSAQDFLNGVIKSFESLSGAADAQANSFNGLLSSLSDLAPKFLREFFGPMDAATGKVQGLLGAIQPYLAQLVEVLMAPEVLDAVRNMGIELGKMAEGALAWGRDLVLNYAQGIASGLGYLLDTLSMIGDMVAYWLMPGSPPRILPDIDKWGAGTMQAWLDGFKQVNANAIFMSLGDSMERFMRSHGKKDDANLIPQIIGGQDLIRQAVEEFSYFGQVTNQTLNAIGRAAGENGLLFQQFIGNYFEVQKATLQLSKAQEAAAKISEQYDKRLMNIRERMDAITAARVERDEQKQIQKLQRILNDPRASAKRRKKAQEDLELLMLTREERKVEKERNAALLEAQKKIEAAEKELMLAQERMTLTEQQLQALDKQNALLEAQMQLLERLAKQNEEKAPKGGSGERKAGPPVSLGGFDFSGGRQGIGGETLFDKLSKQIGLDKLQTKWDTFTGSLSKIWSSIQPFVAPTEGFFSRIGAKLGTLITALQGFWDKNFGKALESIKLNLPTATTVFNTLTGAVESLITAITNFTVDIGLPNLQNFIDWVKEEWPSWSSVFTGTTEEARDSLLGLNDSANEVGDTFEIVKRLILAVMTAIVRTVQNELAMIQLKVKTFSELLGIDWEKTWEAVKTVVASVMKFINDDIKAKVDSIKSIIKIITDILNGDWKRAWSETKQLIKESLESIATNVTNLKNVVDTAFTFIWQWILDRANAIKNSVPGIFEDMKNAVISKITELRDTAYQKFDQLRDWLLNPNLIDWAAVGFNIIQDIIEGFLSAVTGVGGLFATANWVMSQLEAIFNPPVGPSMPTVNAPATSYSSALATGQTVINKNYNLSMTSTQSSGNVAWDFAIMETMT